MSDRDITDLLVRAGDDQGRPLRTDPGELLARARRETVRRHRVRGAATLLVAAALVVGVVLVPRLVGDRASAPVAPVAPRPSSGPYLSTATVIQRCRPQLAKYAGLPGYDAHPTTAPWHLSHEGRRYRVGDLVQLTVAGGDVGRPVLCMVPQRGHERDPVGFARFDLVSYDFVGHGGPHPVGNIGLLRDLCAEQATDVGDGGVRITDLRDSTVLASSLTGDLAAALLRGPDGHLYGCITGPPPSDPADFYVRPIADGPGSEKLVNGGNLVARVDLGDDPDASTSTCWVLAGRFDRRARTLTMTDPYAASPDQNFRIKNGYVAAVALWRDVSGTSRLMVRTWKVEAADGMVLASGTL